MDAWFRDKDFTTDWFSGKMDKWKEVLAHLRAQDVKVLEVGSWEGRSAVFLANYLPRSTIVCVDIFSGDFESRFDRNVAEFGNRIEKHKGSAISILDGFISERRKFTLIYLDAGKKRDHVLGMSLLAWRLLRRAGIVIWDDYSWGPDLPSTDRPHDGIDIFLALHEGEYRLLEKGRQVMIRRIPSVATPAVGTTDASGQVEAEEFDEASTAAAEGRATRIWRRWIHRSRIWIRTR